MSEKHPQYAHVINGRYQYQRRVPKELQPILGFDFWRMYLGTGDANIAAIKIHALAAEHDALKVAYQKLSESEKKQVAEAGGLDNLKEKAASLYSSISFLKVAAEMSPSDIDDEGDEYPYEMVVDQVKLQREAQALVSQRSIQLKDAKNVLSKFNGSRPAETDSVLGFYPEWLRLKPTGKEHSAKVKTTVRRFAEAIGDLRLQDVTRQHVRIFANMWAEMPNTNYLPTKDRHAPMPTLVAMGKAKGIPKVSDVSANKQLDHLRGYFAVALSEGKIENNPAHGVKISTAKKSFAEKQDAKRLPMSGDQIKKFLEAIHKDQDRMIARICVYQGCRLEEAGQLAKSDFATIDGVYCVSIHDRGPNRVKNAPSVRTIPVHPELVNVLKKHNEHIQGDKLFPKLVRKNDRLTHYVSNRLNAMIRSEITSDRRIVFHSLRHSFIDACRVTGMPDGIRYGLGGHSNKEANSVAEGYGRGPSLKEMAKWLAKVDPLKL